VPFVTHEAIYLEFSTRQIAALGIDQQSVLSTLRSQNALTPLGFIQAGPERIALRVGRDFASKDKLRVINLRVDDRLVPLIPIAHEVFWGPMAYAMMGGIVVGTILTLLFLPALYVAWFRMSVQTQA
jgi:multidrug efflux pump subunit AcrB